VFSQVFQAADLKGATSLGFGFWTRYLATYPVYQSSGKANSQYFIARMT
jgi:hypothetical protein